MNNYEWQKQYARQKIEARLREAELHRLAAEGRQPQDSNSKAPRHNPLSAALQAMLRLFPPRRSAAGSQRLNAD